MKKIYTNELTPSWIYEYKKEVDYMTRIAASSDGDTLIVGSDTLTINTLTGNHQYKHKLFYNDKVIIASLGALDFYFLTGKYSIDRILNEALSFDNVNDTINFLTNELLSLYEIYKMDKYFSQILIFWKEDIYKVYALEITYSKKYKQAIKTFSNTFNMNNKLLTAGNGVKNGFSIIDKKYVNDDVKNNILNAIHNTTLNTVGGNYEYVKFTKSNLETNIK